MPLLVYVDGVTRLETAEEEAERLAREEAAANVPAVFQPIERYDFWLAVKDAMGLRKDDVIAAIDASALSDDQKYDAKLVIADAQRYRRDDPNVVLLLNLMGYSEQEADAFWRWATPVA
ncbi:hypothetical protein EVC11_001 [Rhizobium phage RHph_I20]|uniref:Uncharacterized protein n=1 Tax=Rhizobium phage RHph_I20 TaxID=2509730 RepID=A0A7S5UYQ1_9CAUD|nr:hypothetical protein EVC11_001 [Rhizobium phage RHph_I20]